MKLFKDTDQITALAVFIVLLIFALLGCEKDISNETSDKSQPTADSVVIHESISGIRSGRVYPVWHDSSYTIDNFLLAGSTGYTNEQYLFNKDSIRTVTFTKVDNEIVGLYGAKYGVYHIKIDYKNELWQDFEMICFAKDKGTSYKSIPTGRNYGKDVNHYIMYKREVQTLRYYDTTFSRWKLKYRYSIMGSGFIYRDFLSSTLEKSDIFRLEHKP